MEEEAGGEYTVQAGHQGLHRAALLPHTQHKVFPEKKYLVKFQLFTLLLLYHLVMYFHKKLVLVVPIICCHIFILNTIWKLSSLLYNTNHVCAKPIFLTVYRRTKPRKPLQGKY